ncbi:MAG: hypothetical protein PHS14_06710 [Elusimicrobia bacterium]|nr:hypothetical protein [Elusimicrobiota bacterium]
MMSGVLFFLAMIAAFIVFGSLGLFLGKKLQRRGVGENLEGGCAVILGVGGALITMGIINLLTHK